MEINEKFLAIIAHIKTKSKAPDPLSNHEIAENEIRRMLTDPTTLSDSEKLNLIKELQEIQQKDLKYKKLSSYQKPKKYWGYLFCTLATIPCSLLYYNIFLFEDHSNKTYHLKFNLFLFGLFIALVILANISFRPINMTKILKSLQRLLGRS